MWERLLRSFQLIHAIVVVIAAVGFFAFWARTRFWLPKYVHVLAAISMVLGLLVGLLMQAAPKLPPVTGPPPVVGLVFITFLFPALVYFFFIFYGGQHAAFKSSSATQAPCPFCHTPLEAIGMHNGSQPAFVEPECPTCGHELSNTL